MSGAAGAARSGGDVDRAGVLAPMTTAFYDATFLRTAVESYARQNVAAGRWPAATALELSRAEYQRLLPDGPASPGAHLYEIRDPAMGDAVGFLWLGVQPLAGRPAGYVFSIEIDAAHRRRGFARRALVELETIARDLGLASLGLNVFAFNSGARSLYAGLGYEVTAMTMRKPLAGPADDGD